MGLATLYSLSAPGSGSRLTLERAASNAALWSGVGVGMGVSENAVFRELSTDGNETPVKINGSYRNRT